MQITIKALGKLDSTLQNLALNYLKRLKLLKININQNIIKNSKDEEKALEWLFSNLQNVYSIALSEQGAIFSSQEFSNFLFSLPNRGYSKVMFIVGGASGISSNYLKKANFVLSFSKLTFPHELFRVLLLEQLYRAETIFLKHPYHK